MPAIKVVFPPRSVQCKPLVLSGNETRLTRSQTPHMEFLFSAHRYKFNRQKIAAVEHSSGSSRMEEEDGEGRVSVQRLLEKNRKMAEELAQTKVSASLSSLRWSPYAHTCSFSNFIFLLLSSPFSLQWRLWVETVCRLTRSLCGCYGSSYRNSHQT